MMETTMVSDCAEECLVTHKYAKFEFVSIASDRKL